MTKVRDREQVIDAAATVFAEKGFEAARLEEIAAKLGILKGSLYYYASSKLELLILVQRRRHLELIERATTIAASAAPPLERLGEIVRLHLRRFDEFYPESMEWLTTSPRTEASARFVEDSHQLNRRFERILCELIREAVARGDCRPEIDPQVATLGLLGMCNWTSRWYRKNGRLSMDAIVDNYLAIAFHGLSAGAPAASQQR